MLEIGVFHLFFKNKMGVSHLIDRLESRFGITGNALQWFRTYLKYRSTRVMINNAMSRHHIFNYSVPQGSIVGPQAFIMYTSSW